MKITPLLASYFLFAASAALLAQDPTPTPAKEPPPDPPLLGTAPAECQWTITYTPKTPEKEPTAPEDIQARNMRRHYTPIILSKRVLKSNGQVVIYTTYEAGIKSESWVVDGFLYELPWREGQSIQFDSSRTPEFADVSWINAGNFRGTVELKGTKVHLYEIGEPSTSPTPAPSAAPGSKPATKTPHKRAYIDAGTRLPVMVDLGDTVLTYQYSGPAATFPTPDERIKAFMQNAAMSRKKVSANRK